MDEDGVPTPFSLTLNATDPDGDTITWTLQAQAGVGAASVSGTGNSQAVSYTPNANYYGTDSFIVRVSDGLGGTDSITVNVNIISVNDDPVSQDDTKATSPNSPVTINVLDNDSDPENDTLTITAVTQGSKGTVIHDGTAVTYTPNAGESGSDSFTYTIGDGNGGSSTATVTVQLGLYYTFIPVVSNNYVSAPDLVVTQINASSDLIEVVIENQGTQATADGFWVDFYIAPNPVPTQENELWKDVAKEGIAWGVDTVIQPGTSLTLTYSTAPGAPNLYYSAANSGYSGSLPADTAVYAQVDSAHLNTTYGGVLETHEILGESYNNVSSQYTAVAARPALAETAVSTIVAEPVALPERRESN
jgi:Big-like domain-containing protein